MPPPYAILMEKVGKNYASRPVLSGVDMKVERGKAVSLFGENGSGKTSLLKIASSLSPPSSGSVTVAGFDTSTSAKEARGKIGLVSHEDCLYDRLSAEGNLSFFCRLHGVSDPEGRARELVDRFEIARSSAPCGSLSAGMKKRVSIARAVSHNPEVIVMDEPFSGLDRKGGAILSDLIIRLRDGGAAVLFSTHLTARAAELADFAALLLGGRIAFYENSRGMSAGELEEMVSKPHGSAE